MPGTFEAADAVQLAVVERDGFVESRHVGSAIVLGPDGEPVRTLGDPTAAVLGRSTLKPFQAVAVLGAGADLAGESLAIATASHTGTRAHVQLVNTLLARAQTSASALRCPAAWPADEGALQEAVRAGAGPQPVFMNCSGQHAAMLLACAGNGWPLENYLDPGHPLQVQVQDTLERMTGERVRTSAVDGCGMPVPAFSLAGLARAAHRMATAQTSSPFGLYRNAAAVREAVLAHGWVVDGPGRPTTAVIDRLGVFTKGGAEGVMIMAARNGTALALKVLDGGARATTVIGLALLASAGAIDPAAVDDLEAGITANARTARAGVVRAAIPD